MMVSGYTKLIAHLVDLKPLKNIVVCRFAIADFLGLMPVCLSNGVENKRSLIEANSKGSYFVNPVSMIYVLQLKPSS